MIVTVPRLGANTDAPFPPPWRALRKPQGLLAMGGDLSPQRLIAAYRQGIFPWYDEGQPVLWWSPDQRMVFLSDAIHLSRRFRRSLRASTWTVRMDGAFSEVIGLCAEIPREKEQGTWITADMRAAYITLHQQGIAHSVEVLSPCGRLVGGLYGVHVGRMFFAESMFSVDSGGSKVALAALGRHLADWGWPLIDAQIENPHLQRMGAILWPRAHFLDALAPLIAMDEPCRSWAARFGEFPARNLA